MVQKLILSHTNCTVFFSSLFVCLLGCLFVCFVLFFVLFFALFKIHTSTLESNPGLQKRQLCLGSCQEKSSQNDLGVDERVLLHQ